MGYLTQKQLHANVVRLNQTIFDFMHTNVCGSKNSNEFSIKKVQTVYFMLIVMIQQLV